MADTENDTTPEDTTTEPNTGAAASIEGSDSNGATKGYLGHDAADLQADPDLAARHDLTVPREVTPSTFADHQPPGGHPNDPTSAESVGAGA